MDRVVFACRHNAGRSQMAAAFFNLLADPARARAVSAGTNPSDRIHPVVSDAMKEMDIDLEGVKPRLLTAELAAGARLLVTLGCGEECPFVPGVEVEDWPLPDPKDQPIGRVREIRDQVEARVRELLRERRWERDPATGG